MTETSPQADEMLEATPVIDAASPEPVIQADIEFETSSSRPAERPEHIPVKFWDEQAGTVRTEALARSYSELERRLSRGGTTPEAALDDPAVRERLLAALGRPGSPEEYAIEPPDDILAPDATINQRLHEAGFTQAQAQLVYDLAAERLLPMLDAAAAEMAAQNQHERLVRHFGGETAWREAARQIKAWGQSHLDPAALETLSSSSQGVLAIHNMMQANEPRMVQEGDHRRGMTDEASLHEMMRDPRYWRDRDAQFIARVTEGFKKLYAG